MTYIRSAIFLVFIGLWTLICGFLGMATFISFNAKVISITSFIWSHGVTIALRVICGVKVIVKGKNNFPKKPFIVASKHQSAWETMFYLSLFRDPVFILKHELTRIPVYGWYLPLLGMISIDRKKRVNALAQVNEGIQRAALQKRVVIIFPEGTRVAPGARIPYKSGIAAVHKALPYLPIVPVALNSGTIWPRRSWLITPGTITVSVLPALNGQHTKKDLLEKLQKLIDEESEALCFST